MTADAFAHLLRGEIPPRGQRPDGPRRRERRGAHEGARRTAPRASESALPGPRGMSTLQRTSAYSLGRNLHEREPGRIRHRNRREVRRPAGAQARRHRRLLRPPQRGLGPRRGAAEGEGPRAGRPRRDHAPQRPVLRGRLLRRPARRRRRRADERAAQGPRGRLLPRGPGRQDPVRAGATSRRPPRPAPRRPAPTSSSSSPASSSSCSPTPRPTTTSPTSPPRTPR